MSAERQIFLSTLYIGKTEHELVIVPKVIALSPIDGVSRSLRCNELSELNRS